MAHLGCCLKIESSGHRDGTVPRATNEHLMQQNKLSEEDAPAVELVLKKMMADKRSKERSTMEFS
jgi:hypothetical protein